MAIIEENIRTGRHLSLVLRKASKEFVRKIGHLKNESSNTSDKYVKNYNIVHNLAI